MSVDRLLTAALRAYQEPHSLSEIDRVFATTTTLLANLNNPLNLSLLTSHLLTARAIWDTQQDLRTCLRVVGVFSTAAIHVHRNEAENATRTWPQQTAGGGLRFEAWARAVAKGADERSSRWKHTLVLTGILMGISRSEQEAVSRGLQRTLEQAVVKAANLALADHMQTHELGANAVVMALTFAFPTLSEPTRQALDSNLVLRAAVEAMIGREGFQDGEFLRTLCLETVAGHDEFQRGSSVSFVEVERLETRPLVQNMGPLSRLAAFAVEHATDSGFILEAQDRLLAFSFDLNEKWRQCPLSGIDLLAEAAKLSPDVLHGPWVMLWKLLKKIMYTVVATLQPIIGRSLLDPRLNNDATAPVVASKTLHALRNLYFISSRQGADAFQVYVFTYFTSLDIITRYPEACISFLQGTEPPPPPDFETAPPLDEALTLFYLNTAEHLPLPLPTPMAESLILAPATSRLSRPASPRTTSLTMPLFEAAHSAILSVLSCPQHSSITIPLIPFYVDTLLSSFPSRISPRQFRLAFKTVMQIASPPFPISASHPDLAETLLEMIVWRAREGASTAPLPPEPSLQPQPQAQSLNDAANATPVSEQTTLVLSLIDSLPFLPLPIVEQWLTRTAEAMNQIADPAMRETARRRFWDVLVSGEMDVERAAIGVEWWGNGGGKEMVMMMSARGGGGNGDEGKGEGDYLMSGALGNGTRTSHL